MQIHKAMVEQILNDPDRYSGDQEIIKQKVAESKAIYKGEPVPHLYVPLTYQEEDVETFKSALCKMFEVVNKTIELYLESETVRRLFNFDPKLDTLIRLPHYYKAYVPMGRFDLFYYGVNQYMFCELNADGASAMNEQKELEQVIRQGLITKDFENQWSFETFELFDSWVEEVGVIFDQYQTNRGLEKKNKSETTVAIVDFIDKSSPIEFEVFQEAFVKAGYKCLILDPRDITCKAGKMNYQGKDIDIVYRRLVTKDLMDRYDEITGFIEGLLGNSTCLIGSLKTQIIHTKRFFEVLHHPEFKALISKDLCEFIDAHIPWTKRLSNEEHYLNQKDAFIIKPVDYYASKGVCAGSDFNAQDWQQLIEEKSKEDFIVQKYCPLSLADNVLYNKDTGFKAHSFKTITGLFAYNEKLAGVYVRGGLNAIISGLHSGYTFATLIAKEK